MDLPDPFRITPDNPAQLQLEAVRQWFADMVQRVPVLARRAKEEWTSDVVTPDKLIQLLFEYTNCESHP